MSDDLNALRREAAEDAYMHHDYSYEIADASGWEFQSGTDEWSRPVFYVDPDDSSRPSIKGTFVMRFEPGSTSVAEVQAYDPNGPVGDSLVPRNVSP